MNTAFDLAAALSRVSADLRHDGHACHADRIDKAAREVSAMEVNVAMLRADNATLRDRLDRLASLASTLHQLVSNAVQDVASANCRAAVDRARAEAAELDADTARADLGTMREMLGWTRHRRDMLQRTLDAIAADAATDADAMEAAGQWDISVCRTGRGGVA